VTKPLAHGIITSLQTTKPVSGTRLRLRLSATAETIVRGGHPWLFADSVRDQNRDGQPGELAVIYDRNDRFLAIGLFDPESPLRVRILHAGKPLTIDEAWWREHFSQALARRKGLFDKHTDGFRWINGESDGWPGLVLDRYADTLVLKIYTSAWLSRLNEVTSLVREQLKPVRLVLRLSRNIREYAQKKGLQDGSILLGEKLTGPVIFRETGIAFEADVLRGQKTGFFLDQRENRRQVETFARGADVLNAFSFSGGFSLYAARGGAVSVTDLDLSEHALESANRNFSLNAADAAIAACRHETIQTDAFKWLENNAGKSTAKQFDVVILDPPSLAKREAERAGAIQAYGKLAANGIKALRRQGVLVAASCSAHVSALEFFEAVRLAARNSGRRFTELATAGHPPDHPATFAEAQYLKCIYLRSG
jgi:23S rRNA (cytosine1962-C5)-methyltransferase